MIQPFFSVPTTWTPEYTEQIERNIGLISVADQEKLRTTKIAILGVGGIGAPIALQLAYAGCEKFVLADKDFIERSNLNRQPYHEADIGKRKVEQLSLQLKAINPKIDTTIYNEVTPENVSTILKGVQIIALTLDGALGSISVAREARLRKIPIVETWGVPYLFAWWFLPESPDYEDVYNLPTKNSSLPQIQQSSEVLAASKAKLIEKLLVFPGIRDRYNQEPKTVEKLLAGEISLRSFSPIIWLNASYCAWQLMFAGILNRVEKTLAPNIQVFDYFTRNFLKIV